MVQIHQISVVKTIQVQYYYHCIVSPIILKIMLDLMPLALQKDIKLILSI